MATVLSIETAALQQFLKRGFDETTAEHIAAAAGVSIRTFFRHFPGGKEDVVLRNFRRWTARFVAALAKRPPQESAWTAVRAAMTSVMETGEESPQTAKAAALHYEVARRFPELHARMNGERLALAESIVDMAALRMSLDPTTDMRPRLLVHTMVAAATVSWMAWLDDPTADPNERFQVALDLVEEGMAHLLETASAPPG
jgi:AcrR family transcriptional regulator